MNCQLCGRDIFFSAESNVFLNTGAGGRYFGEKICQFRRNCVILHPNCKLPNYMPLNTEKNLKRYYSIGEVAEMFNVNDTLLRFWEKEFPQITPKKVGRGVRQYTRENIETIRVIYNLVKVRGLRIEAARELLKKNYEGTAQSTEVVDRLRAIREELLLLKRQLGDLQ